MIASSPATDADLEQQKADYMSVIQTCMAVPGCVGVTVWDHTDRLRFVAVSHSTLRIGHLHRGTLGFQPPFLVMARVSRGTRYVALFDCLHTIS